MSCVGRAGRPRRSLVGEAAGPHPRDPGSIPGGGWVGGRVGGGGWGGRCEGKPVVRWQRFSSNKSRHAELVKIRYSLAGQDTRLSPERPGFESQWRKLFWSYALDCLVTAAAAASRSTQPCLRTQLRLAGKDSQLSQLCRR